MAADEKQKPGVALVLSSGSARGFVHIGAIEALERAGYEITSVAGTSMGALIGGMYAAGKLAEIKDWLVSLDRKKVFQLVDFSFSLNHVVKGRRVMDAIAEIVPDTDISQLPIPFCAVAADVQHGEEIDFREGSLLKAVRASISLPSILRPMHTDGRILIDGGAVNPIPLNRVKRHDGDILVAINVNAPADPVYDLIRRQAKQRLKAAGSSLWQKLIPDPEMADSNYYTLLSNTFSLMIQSNTERALQITPPDIRVDIPVNRFGEFDYDRAGRIVRVGRMAMKRAIEAYESRMTATS
ncbi:MAG: patatin-like phospholipase family protein [Alloprevotella sp.]